MFNLNRINAMNTLWRISILACTIAGMFSLIASPRLQAVQPSGGPSLPIVYVNRQNTTAIEDGSSEHPFNTIAEGVAVVESGGSLVIHSASYGETLTIDRAMQLQSNGGVVTIGIAVPPPLYKIYLPLINF